MNNALVIRLKGGLGNQLFQYATGYAIAKKHNLKLVMNPSMTSNMTSRHIEIQNMQLEYQEYIYDEHLPRKVKLYKNKYINKLIRLFFSKKDFFFKKGYFLETQETFIKRLFDFNETIIYLDGYFQTDLYFEDFKKSLIKQFKMNYVASEEYNIFLKKIQNVNSVAVHIRHGDFKKSRNKYHYILNKQYYINAIKIINEKIENPYFFVFSDDNKWAGQFFNNQFEMIHLQSDHADIEEFNLMKNCKSIITANSTFSWWAAWLNETPNSIVITPAKAYGNKYMIPQNWVVSNDL